MLVYVDNVIINTATEEQHLVVFEEVLRRLEKEQLMLKLKKAEI